jgi:hypothetical protein
MNFDFFDTSALHLITETSLWDSPLSASLPDPPSNQIPIDSTEIIRANQQRIVPYISELRSAAQEVAASVAPEEVARLEERLNVVIFYRLPDFPKWASQFSVQI